MTDTATMCGGYVSLNPAQALPLAGFHDRPSSSGRVHLPLEANAVLFRWEGRAYCVVQLDVLSVGRAVRDAIASALADIIPAEHLFVCASHTHFAPNIDADIPLLGAVDEEYVTFVCREVIQLVRDLDQKQGIAVMLSESSVATNAAVNRRKRCWNVSRTPPFMERGTLTLPNPKGGSDPRVRSIRLAALEGAGATAGVLWNFACHPVGMPDLSAISSEFPGAARNRIRAAVGESIPVLFLPGFMGDVRPRIVDSSWDWCRTVGGYAHRFFEGPRFRAFTPAEWEVWSDHLAGNVVQATLAASSLEPVRPIARRLSRPLNQMAPGADAARELSVQFLGLNEGVGLLGLSAEVLSGYAAFLSPDRWRGKRLLAVGYLDGVAGYLPTRRALAEGGYEVSESRVFFGLPLPFRDDVEEIVDGMFLDVLSESPRSHAH